MLRQQYSVFTGKLNTQLSLWAGNVHGSPQDGELKEGGREEGGGGGWGEEEEGEGGCGRDGDFVTSDVTFHRHCCCRKLLLAV